MGVTKMSNTTTKPLPDPVYPCLHCYEDYSWPAEDLHWSSDEQGWVCRNCWDDTDNYGQPLGVSLAEELKQRGMTR